MTDNKIAIGFRPQAAERRSYSETGNGMNEPIDGRETSQMDAYWTDRANEMLAFLDPDNERQLSILRGDLAGLRNALKGTRFETMEDRELATVAATTVTLTRRRDDKS
jgi:hypothetical protein